MSTEAAGSYPSELDVEWVAVDRVGRVAVFTTGGVGPIPRVYLDQPGILDCTREAVWAALERTESVLLVSLPRPDDYEAFARRGFFAFDWCDVHRTTGRSGLYEIQARPVAPAAFVEAAWPAELSVILVRLRNPLLDFAQPSVDVSVLDCVYGPV
jgi:hypothetical protein